MSNNALQQKQLFLKKLYEVYQKESGLLFPFGLWEKVREIKRSQVLYKEEQNDVISMAQVLDDELLFEWTSNGTLLNLHKDMLAKLRVVTVREPFITKFREKGFQLRETFVKYSREENSIQEVELPERFMLKNVAPTNEAQILADFLNQHLGLDVTENRISSWTLRHVYDLNGWLWLLDTQETMTPVGVLLAEYDMHSSELHFRWFFVKEDYRYREFYLSMFYRVLSEFPSAKIITMTLPSNHFLVNDEVLNELGFYRRETWGVLEK